MVGVRGLLPILDADCLDRLELISSADMRRFHAGQDSPVFRIARCLGEASVASVQLRCKGEGLRCASFVSVWVEALRRHAPGVAIIVNDHVELALTLAADGVHVGQEDMPVARCRLLLGPERMVGLSTHTLAEVQEANRMAVDYIGYGPLFATHSKPDAQAARGMASLAEVCRLAVKPVVAIGGIQVAHLEQIAASGAAAAAMISGLWQRVEGWDAWAHRLREAVKQWKPGESPTG
ncbi:MAG: thiamine phosphate synthase [Magnetococcales bacterium]|nr:thiamine phosphate synthase [Magnetococcales bacterium]